MPLPQEDSAFTSTPVLAFLARFLPDRTTLSLEAWHVDDAAAQITLHVTSTHARVPLPTLPRTDLAGPQPVYTANLAKASLSSMRNKRILFPRSIARTSQSLRLKNKRL